VLEGRVRLLLRRRGEMRGLLDDRLLQFLRLGHALLNQWRGLLVALLGGVGCDLLELFACSMPG